MEETVKRNNNNFEYIVISTDEKRKETFLEQYKTLSFKAPFSFLKNPATVQNSEKFVDCIEDVRMKKVVCCLISHLRAIRQSVLKGDTNLEFAVILEDDVAFLKKSFEDILNELTERWDELVHPDKIASVGWIPCRDFENYEVAASSRIIKSEIVKGKTSKILRDRYVPGLQGYVIKKSDFVPFVNHLFKDENYIETVTQRETYIEFKRTLDKLIDHPKFIKGEKVIVASDRFLNYIFEQAIVFPPLIVEQDFDSTIGNTNTSDYWNNFFKGEYKHLKNNYFFF